MTEYFKTYDQFVRFSPEKMAKVTLFQSEKLLLGLNCLEPGQSQSLHLHDNQDKFYYVIEGTGEFTVGDETKSAASGVTVWAPAGVPHGVTNTGSARLVLLIGIAPFPDA